MPNTFRHRRLTSFSLRTGTIAVTLFGVWLGLHYRSVRKQRASVEAVARRGGTVWYDYEADRRGFFGSDVKSPVPAWLLNCFGRDHFHDIVGALTGPYDGAVVKPRTGPLLTSLSGFPDLEVLSVVQSHQVNDQDSVKNSRFRRLRLLEIANGDEVTSEGVRHLAHLKHLQQVFLYTPSPDVDPSWLSRKLPDCVVYLCRTEGGRLDVEQWSNGREWEPSE